jgi:hypothetical protein
MSFAGLVALDVGAWDVPRDMVAQIHAGETVVPQSFAEGMRSAMSRGNDQPVGRSGGDMHMHITATDAESFEKQLTRSNSGLNRMIKRSIRDHNLPLRR